MREGVPHCHCSKCYVLPPKWRLKRRPHIQTLLGLSDDVLLYILEYLPALDIQSMRKVHPHLRSLVDSRNSVWARACFHDVWPSPENLELFERAAERGSFEACVKLGIAYLYNEGLSMSDDGQAELNGLRAAHYFYLTEKLNTAAGPFVWLFFRPPWSTSGSCCKAVVFGSLKVESLEEAITSSLRGSLQYCLAKVLNLLEDEEKKKEALRLFEASASNGCLLSSYLTWKSKQESEYTDPGKYLQSLRELRDYAARGCWEAQISLAKFCVQRIRFCHEWTPPNLVLQVFQSSIPSNATTIFSKQKGMSITMRYILVDWLVEVATMKDFSSLCLHMTVGLVDRYLKRRSVPRARLQLVGITCMVICTRFISNEILTIREAAWLTDNTYKYEDLVRMMGEIISAVEGKIQMPTVIDYKDILTLILPFERSTMHLCSYISDLSLLYTELTVYSPAHLAAAALLLARILYKQAIPWTAQLVEFTGFTLEHLTPCVLLLHKKCFHDDAPKDYRQVSLTAVRQRFQSEYYDYISNVKQVMDYSELCTILGVSLQDIETPPSSTIVEDFYPFLCSPAGNKTKRRREDSLQEDRGSFVTTPIAELSNQEEALVTDFLDWSLDTSCSGYEGDRESEGEREGDVSSPSGILEHVINTENMHCQDSSDEDIEEVRALPTSKPNITIPSLKMSEEISSGYSSVSSAGSPMSSPNGPPCTPTPGLSSSKLVPIPFPQPSPSNFKAVRRQVKRKNRAQHSDEKVTDAL